ncbi:MAG: penicillin-binding transpeptidase domain-containing protein [Alphaproteobacteria bacterium]
MAQRIRVVAHSAAERSLGFAFDLAADQARQLVPSDTPDLVVQTTIDPTVQTAADTSIRTNLGNRAFGRRPLQASYMAMDRSGAIRALIGGTNYNASKFDRVTQAHRQPGSAFKTFVYTAALEHGLDTEDVRFDEPVMINGWQPHNYDEGYRGPMTLRTAFALSINTVAAEVANEIGPANVAAVARRLGVTTMPPPNQNVPPSIALGSIEVTLWDMVTAFGAYMNDGVHVEPYMVESVSDAAGHQLYHHTPLDPKQAPRVLAPEIAERMTSMMGAVVIRGTGNAARLGDRDVAGKTGTSTDYRDAWFIGYTADYTAGVWIGHDDYTPMQRITGGTIPAQIWADSMRAAHRGIDPHPLPGIEQPAYSEAQDEVSSFFDSLAQAFGGGDQHKDDDDQPSSSDDNHDTF